MVDRNSSGRPLAERVRDLGLVQQALSRAVCDALQRHKQAGNPVAVWRDGRTIWLDPDDIPVTAEAP